MNAQELTEYLRSHIPLSEAMAVKVTEIRPRSVVLEAPLAPNINHRNTLFGGSAASVATLAAWSVLYLCMKEEGLKSRLVIQRSTMAYERPVTGSFQAVARLSNEGEWSRFLRVFERRGRARITVKSELQFEGQKAARLEGEFVALRYQDDSESNNV